MKLKEMFQKRKNYAVVKNVSKAAMENGAAGEKPEVPEGLLKKCNFCKSAILTEDVKKGYYICPECHGYFRMTAMTRIEMIADEGSFEEWDCGMEVENPLGYKGYEEKIEALREKTNLNEAIVTGKAMIQGHPAVIGVCDGRFMMASMGHVVGEKIARAVELATKEKLPVILFACSGGARMQEGIVSLMQMAKTSAALKRHSDEGGLYISVLTDPTTGGVTASFAMLGDIILAEPNALIGFAGPRVIEQTIGQKLPKGFQRAEFLLEHGFIDRIVARPEMKQVLADILKMHEMKQCENRNCTVEIHESNVHETERCNTENDGEIAFRGNSDVNSTATAINLAGGRVVFAGNPSNNTENKTTFSRNKNISAWERVQLSRRNDRPVGTNYIEMMFDNFIEFHGDRYYKDDRAIVGGIAMFHGQPVTVIAQAKGSTTKENIERNFGMPSPEGYRKTLRLMKQAEKFHRPVICFVDTPGAFCGLEAEERGQGEAIARNLFEMSTLRTPVLSLVIGEGGSGGALAMAVSDEVWMMENSIYSILSPEGFASILWKDSKRAEEAAKVMKLTADNLKELGIIEKIISEPELLTADTMVPVCVELEKEMEMFLEKYQQMEEEELLNHRYDRFRNF